MGKWTYSRARWMSRESRQKDLQQFELEELFKEVIHTDGINPNSFWEKFKVYVLLIFIGIPKFILAFGSFTITCFIVRAICFGAKSTPEHPLNKFRFGLSRFVLRIGCRLLLFWLGIWWIRVKRHRYVESDPNDPSKSRKVSRREHRKREARIRKENVCIPTISNHLTFLDPIVLISKFGAMGYISRKGTENVPIAGPMIQNACDAILVDRSSAESRRETAMEMTRRALGERMSRDGRVPHVTVFPEGTTTNGSTIITFRNGVFRAGRPVRPVAIQMPNRFFNPSWETIPIKLCLLRYLSQLWIPMTIHVMPTYEPTESESSDPNLYAENARRSMSQYTGIPLGTSTTSEKMLLLEYVYGKPQAVPSGDGLADPATASPNMNNAYDDENPKVEKKKNKKNKKAKPAMVKISWTTLLERLSTLYKREGKTSEILNNAMRRAQAKNDLEPQSKTPLNAPPNVCEGDVKQSSVY